MSDQPQEEQPDVDEEELEHQEAELLPDREAMSLLGGPLRGPVPLDAISPPPPIAE